MTSGKGEQISNAEGREVSKLQHHKEGPDLGRWGELQSDFISRTMLVPDWSTSVCLELAGSA